MAFQCTLQRSVVSLMAIVVLSSFALLLIGVFVIAYCGLNGAQITLFSALHKDVSAALTAVFEEKKLAARVLAIDFLVRNYDKQSTDYENFFKAIYPYSMTWHNASAMYFCGANGYITAVDHRPFGVRHVLSSSPPDLVYKRYTINTNTSTCPSCDYLKLDYVTNIRNKLNATERPYFIAGRSAPPEGKWTPIYVSSSRGMYVLPFVVPIRAHDGALHSLAIVDYTLTGLGDILTTVQVGKTGQLFIVDDCAHLIASSVETIDPSGSNTLRHATNSTDRTTRDAAHFILSNNAVPDKLYRLTASGRIYYLTISRFVLDHTTQAYWRIVVLVPLADFTDNTSTVIAAVILVTACVSATVLAAACCLARRLTRRLQAIVHEIDSVVTYVAPEQRRGGSPLEFASLPSPSPRNSPRTRAIAYASAYASATPAGSPPSSARSASSATPFAPPTTSQQAGPPRARAVAAAAHHAQVLGPFEMREIATMRDSVARMKVIIRSFEKYIPDQLLRYLISSNRPAELGLERSMATVMFIDVVGFTTIMEATPVEPLIEQFTEYCNEAINVIVQNHGTLDKMMGDGMMAFFGCPPSRLGDHETWACRAALQIQYCLGEMRKRWEADGRPAFHVRIGLASGRVSVGNVGSINRFQYTVLGDVVNLASRMEGLNKYFGTGCLITGPMYQAIDTQHRFVTRQLATVRVKGRSHRTRIYELVTTLELFKEDVGAPEVLIPSTPMTASTATTPQASVSSRSAAMFPSVRSTRSTFNDTDLDEISLLTPRLDPSTTANLPSCVVLVMRYCAIFTKAVQHYEAKDFTQAIRWLRMYLQEDHKPLREQLFEFELRRAAGNYLSLQNAAARARADAKIPQATQAVALVGEGEGGPSSLQGHVEDLGEKEGALDYAQRLLAQCEQILRAGGVGPEWDYAITMTEK
eukprot:gnl/Trimastix_PCT/1196.p1 GENE.gnl/Trimastix_PCT/1196~~gnl/Trimastix_PCT/1196.p1  ORF type:complete len:956 (+),score=248.37 gnl/Trimastix_PCT/1196:94-2868(+)